MTSGLSPTTLDKALTDWSHHFAFSPGKSPQLDGQAGGKYAPLFEHLIRSAHQRDAAPAIEPHPQDRGFSDSACARPSPSVLLLFSGATNPWSIVPSLMAKPSRSEEHTSELQSLMRISYAVFCLKKKKKKTKREKNKYDQTN